MSARQRKNFRIAVIAIWLVLALIIVVPVLAQGGTGTTSPTGTSVQNTQPQNINEVAARLAPLLVGAALIERTIEFLFNWSQRAILDTTSSLQRLSGMLTGLVHIDIKQTWLQLQDLNRAMQRRSESGAPPEAGDPNSPDPAQWPLSILENQLTTVQKQLTDAQNQLQTVMNSDLFKERRKIVAGIISIGMGIVLALIAHIQLFGALDVSVAHWFRSPFKVLDMILAGVLMGLGTDWVHQVINLITKGQSYLGRAGGGESGDGQATVDTSNIDQMVQNAVEQQLTAQLQNLQQTIEKRVGDVSRPDS